MNFSSYQLVEFILIFILTFIYPDLYPDQMKSSAEDKLRLLWKFHLFLMYFFMCYCRKNVGNPVPPYHIRHHHIYPAYWKLQRLM